jgi:hypothetical protein
MIFTDLIFDEYEKKTSPAIVFAALLFSCLNHKEEGGFPAVKDSTVSSAGHQHDHAAAVDEKGKTDEGLTLDNGHKWKSDNTTWRYVKDLQRITDSAAGISAPAPDHYRQAGKQLLATVNNLVRDCRMEGPDHKMLHKWLEPLLQKIKLLQQVQDTGSAAVRLRGDTGTRRSFQYLF